MLLFWNQVNCLHLVRFEVYLLQQIILSYYNYNK